MSNEEEKLNEIQQLEKILSDRYGEQPLTVSEKDLPKMLPYLEEEEDEYDEPEQQ